MSEGNSALLARLWFKRVYREHARFVHQRVRRFGVPVSEADDTVQDIFLFVFLHVAAGDSQLLTRGWLSAVARNISRNRLRGLWRGGWRPRKNNAGVDVEQVADEQVQEPETCAARGELLQQLRNALLQLNQEQSQAFILAELEGWTAQEIAVIAAVCPGTVASRVRLARAQLRSALALRY